MNKRCDDSTSFIFVLRTRHGIIWDRGKRIESFRLYHSLFSFVFLLLKPIVVGFVSLGVNEIRVVISYILPF